MDALEKKAFRRSSYASYISHFFALAFSMVTVPLVIKALTPEQYGSYVIINSINTVIVYFTSWGLASVFARYIPEFLEKRYVGGLIKLTIGAIAIRLTSLVLVLTIGWYLSDFVFAFFNFTPFLKTFYAVVLIYVFLFQSEVVVGQMILGAYLEQVKISVIHTFQSAVRFGIVLYVLFCGGDSDKLKMILLGLVAMEGITVLSYLWISTRLTLKKIRAITEPITEPFPVKRMARYGAFTFLLSTTAVFFDVMVDNFVISHYLGVKQVAYYAFACAILGMAAALNPVQKLKSLISHVVIRRYTDRKDFHVFEDLHRLTTTITLGFLIPSLAFICMFSYEIIILLNPQYESAFIIFFIMAPFIIARGLLFCYPYPINVLEKVEYRFYASVFSIYNLIADIVFIQIFGLVGIAIATSSAAVFTAMYYHYVVTRILRIPIRYYWRGLERVFIYVLISLAFALAPGIIGVDSIWLSAALFSIVYFGFVYWKTPLHPDDETIVKDMIWKRKVQKIE